jgi:hypothetical protein
MNALTIYFLYTSGVVEFSFKVLVILWEYIIVTWTDDLSF